MIQIFQRFALKLQRLNYSNLSRIILVTRGPRNFDLFNSNHLPSSGIKSKINASVRPFTDQFSSDPFESSCKRIS